MYVDLKTHNETLYDKDYYLWLEQTIEQLKGHDFSNLDLINLIEEIEGLGRSEKRSISSYLMRLCEHLLKIKYWQSEREQGYRGWKIEVRNFRLQIKAELEASPSLNSFLQDVYVKQYRNARKLFLDASDISPTLVPETPEFTLEEILDEDWFPWQPE